MYVIGQEDLANVQITTNSDLNIGYFYKPLGVTFAGILHLDHSIWIDTSIPDAPVWTGDIGGSTIQVGGTIRVATQGSEEDAQVSTLAVGNAYMHNATTVSATDFDNGGWTILVGGTDEGTLGVTFSVANTVNNSGHLDMQSQTEMAVRGTFSNSGLISIDTAEHIGGGPTDEYPDLAFTDGVGGSHLNVAGALINNYSSEIDAGREGVASNAGTTVSAGTFNNEGIVHLTNATMVVGEPDVHGIPYAPSVVSLGNGELTLDTHSGDGESDGVASFTAWGNLTNAAMIHVDAGDGAGGSAFNVDGQLINSGFITIGADTTPAAAGTTAYADYLDNSGAIHVTNATMTAGAPPIIEMAASEDGGIAPMSYAPPPAVSNSGTIWVDTAISETDAHATFTVNGDFNNNAGAVHIDGWQSDGINPEAAHVGSEFNVYGTLNNAGLIDAHGSTLDITSLNNDGEGWFDIDTDAADGGSRVTFDSVDNSGRITIGNTDLSAATTVTVEGSLNNSNVISLIGNIDPEAASDSVTLSAAYILNTSSIEIQGGHVTLGAEGGMISSYLAGDPIDTTSPSYWTYWGDVAFTGTNTDGAVLDIAGGMQAQQLEFSVGALNGAQTVEALHFLGVDGNQAFDPLIFNFEYGDTIVIKGYGDGELSGSHAVEHFVPLVGGDFGEQTYLFLDGMSYMLQFDGHYASSAFSVVEDTQGTEDALDDTITITLLCFYPGTLIRTPHGEVAVETLKRGDLVVTSDGEAKPITWMGRQTVSRRFADPLRVLPIRIAAGALGDHVPCRDLLVSPDHALLVGGVLIQAGALVNGTTIVREREVPERYTYWHVELDDHSLILAENVPAETFVDNVERLAFDNWAEHEALYPQGKPIVEMAYPRAKAHRQVPGAVRTFLAARAGYGRVAAS